MILKWKGLMLTGTVCLGLWAGFGVREVLADTNEQSETALTLYVQEKSRHREVVKFLYGHLIPSIKQDGRRLTLTLPNIAKQGEVLTAVWEEKSQFSSARWYSYHSNVISVECEREGNYHVGSYLAMNNKLILLDRQVVTVQEDVKIELEELAFGFYELTINHLPEDVVSLYLPVWSEKDGLGEAVWYEVTKSDDGHYQSLLDLSQYAYPSEQLSFQVYARMADGSFKELVKRQTITVAVERLSQEMMSQGIENTYPIGQCTWGVKQVAWWVGNNWGNAKDWLDTAKRLGLTVGTEPRIGAVAVWPNDGVIDGVTYGHVAYVVGVKGLDSIRVLEANYAGHKAIQDYRAWFDPTNAISGGQVYYIYPPARP